MDDPELEAIRRKRMAELMAQQGGGPGGSGGMPQNPEQAAAQAEQRKAQEQQRQDMLRSIMTADARERRESTNLRSRKRACDAARRATDAE